MVCRKEQQINSKALISSDKPKLKVRQSQLQSPHLVSHPNTPRPLSVKSDVPKTSTVGKLLVLKPSWERNDISPTAKESLSPTAGSKLPNSPLAAPSVVGSASLRNMGNSPAVAVVERKPGVEKRPSSQAQSRNNFFNLMRRKSVLYSEKEEARFLRSLGWDEIAEEEEGGLTEEEISSFYRNYLNSKEASSKLSKGTPPKVLMGEISSDSKLES